MAAPDHSQDASRVVELDALRGLAVLGIAWMNVYAFALPIQAYANPMVWGGEGALDRLVWASSFVFIEDKFRTLFAMLFGAGCLILIERSGENVWRSHLARMAVLFIIGFVHALLLASNDVLRTYALAGLAIPLLAPLGHRALYATAIGLVALHVGGGMVAFGSAVVDVYVGRVGSDAALFAERQFGSDPGALKYALELGRQTLAERIDRRIGGFSSQFAILAASIPLNLAAMALGMALWKDRMLRAEWRTFRLQRLAAICALLAIPPLLALAWWVSDSAFAPAFAGAAAIVLSAPFDTLLGLAYAALAMAFFDREGGFTKRLAAVGRLSLTNYLMTSVIFASLFASWGLGLFGEVSRSQAFALSFIPIAAVLAWSPAWLERFGNGPFERVWRWASIRLG
ncbi:hypothetical protein NAP1_11843 [Erythrobacter sp. NAP1]|uniref:DUF418 domain-containing protein n=1 Tax=Erythrobacter sp. NAP1 TaxID=237727 RepID=UPI0000687891|nr:DUF418 domain-containing protein [Erythrobacter sp. NAP1]EAQ28286.1 hypothetical protein NAP1_11843 [Erythrobacter sp. NAP1]